MNMRKLIAVMVFSVFGAAACNTVEGVGEDVRATGEVISDTAKDAQNDLN